MNREARVAVVTGGGTGIGRLTALALWREGIFGGGVRKAA